MKTPGAKAGGFQQPFCGKTVINVEKIKNKCSFVEKESGKQEKAKKERKGEKRREKARNRRSSAAPERTFEVWFWAQETVERQFSFIWLMGRGVSTSTFQLMSVGSSRI